MFNLKDLINKFDRIMTAVTFAEAGEREKALDVLYDQPEEQKERQIGSRITEQEESKPRLRV
jgi:hypothetical protein